MADGELNCRLLLLLLLLSTTVRVVDVQRECSGIVKINLWLNTRAINMCARQRESLLYPFVPMESVKRLSYAVLHFCVRNKKNFNESIWKIWWISAMDESRRDTLSHTHTWSDAVVPLSADRIRLKMKRFQRGRTRAKVFVIIQMLAHASSASHEFARQQMYLSKGYGRIGRWHTVTTSPVSSGKEKISWRGLNSNSENRCGAIG